MSLDIRKATQNDYMAIIHLLLSNQLPSLDIHSLNIELFVGLHHQEIIATLGIEKYDDVALVRSFCVQEAFRSQRIGEAMLQYLFQHCQYENIQSLYLLTTTAENYFKRYGFKTIERATVPVVIQQTKEYSSLCPSSAIMMSKKIK